MKTIKEYTTEFMGYGKITVPAGTETTNKTACGIDKNYNFVNEFGWVKTNYPKVANILLHDLTYHGLNVPAEYIERPEPEIKQEDKNELIAKSEKLADSIKEFYEAKEFEKCSHTINPDHTRNGYYFLIDTRNSETLKHGTPGEIKSYMNLHGIKPEVTYKYSYVNHKFITLNNNQ